MNDDHKDLVGPIFLALIQNGLKGTAGKQLPTAEAVVNEALLLARALKKKFDEEDLEYAKALSGS